MTPRGVIILGYIGNHKKDTLSVRLGWALIRLAQIFEKSPFKRVTHTEVVHAGDNYKCCTIASASARDGGVRSKPDIKLTKGNWIALDVPDFAVEASKRWFAVFNGYPYAWVGAAATKLHFLKWLANLLKGFFCNQSTLQALPAPYIPNPEQYTPSECFDELIKRGAVDVTDLFFKD